MRQAKHAHRSEHTGSGVSFFEGFFVNLCAMILLFIVAVGMSEAVHPLLPWVGFYASFYALNWVLGRAIENDDATGRAYCAGVALFFFGIAALLILPVASGWRYSPVSTLIDFTLMAALCFGVPGACCISVARARRASVVRIGACPECLYSLLGLDGARCPECGWEDPREVSRTADGVRAKNALETR